MKGADNDGVVTKGSGDDGKWWRREVVTMGSGDKGKWWRWELVTKGSGKEGKWVTMGSGEEGKWWWREVLRKGSGDDGKWWGREVVTEGSDDEGEWWGRQVGTMGGGEEGKWWGREVDDGMWWRWGSGEEGKWWRSEVVTMGKCVRKGSADEGKWVSWGGKPEHETLYFFRVKWLQPADERYLVCAAVAVWIVSSSIGSSSVFCNSVVVPVCVVLYAVSWICGCRSHWNGCFIVVLWCCHVRR